MHRSLVVASLTIVALASSATSASAQERAIRDSVAPSAVDAGPVVDTAAHSPTTPRESVMRSCGGRVFGPSSYVLPPICAQQAQGPFARAGFDSATIVRNGQDFRIPLRNAGGIPGLNQQKKAHAVTGAFIGAGLGVMAASIANPHGGSGLRASAIILGGTGAMIGAFSGSKYLTDWPRVLAETAAPSK
jgi:hypothetical protein